MKAEYSYQPSWFEGLLLVLVVSLIVGYLVDGHLTDCRLRAAEKCAATVHKHYGHMHRVDCVR
jgi:hypothetical protein